MDTLISSVNELLSILKDMTLEQDVTIVSEFPHKIKENPITKPVVSYGIKKISAYYDFELNPGGLITDVTVAFTVHAPVTSSGKECQEIFLQAINYLYPQVPELTEFGCGDIKFNRNTSTIELEGYGLVRITLF